VAKKGAKRPIFEGNMPPKKCTPNIGANIGAITGILLITAHTTLTPTRKINGKTRVYTVFYLDSFGQEMPSLVLVKEQYFHSSFPFRLLGVEFSTRATCLATRVARAKIECGWVVKVQASACAENRATTRKSTGKMQI
jgi:hypothetical protein